MSLSRILPFVLCLMPMLGWASVEHGKRRYEAGDYEAAARIFDELILAGDRDPDLLYYGAAAHEALGHIALAHEYIQTFLSAPPPRATRVKKAKELRERLGRELGQAPIKLVLPPLPPIEVAIALKLTPEIAQHGPMEVNIRPSGGEATRTLHLTPGTWTLEVGKSLLTAPPALVKIVGVKGARAETTTLTLRLSPQHWPKAQGQVSAALEAEDRRQWATAAEAFDAAATTGDDPVLFWRAGRAYRQIEAPTLSQRRRALEMLVTYRRLRPDASDREAIDAEIERLKAAVEAAPARLKLIILPAPAAERAQVEVDGRPYTGDLSVLELPGGPHTLLVSAEGFASRSMSVVLEAGDSHTETIDLVSIGEPPPTGDGGGRVVLGVGVGLMVGGLALGSHFLWQTGETPAVGYREEHGRFTDDLSLDRTLSLTLLGTGLVATVVGALISGEGSE